MSVIEGVIKKSVECPLGKVIYYDSRPADTDRETVVLLHGTGGSAENNFWALLPMLAMRHRVIALDFLDPIGDTPQADHYTQQVAAILEAETASGNKKPHLVGYSFGAVIAAAYAANNSSSIGSLTLVAGWVKTDNHQRVRNALWNQLHTNHPEALGQFNVFTSFSASFINARNDAELSELCRKAGTGPDRSVKMRFNKEVDISALIPKITVPTLVVACAYDLMVPKRHSQMLFSALPNARYFEIKSGHAVVHERPAELFTAIDQFIVDPGYEKAGHVIENSHF